MLRDRFYLWISMTHNRSILPCSYSVFAPVTGYRCFSYPTGTQERTIYIFQPINVSAIVVPDYLFL